MVVGHKMRFAVSKSWLSSDLQNMVWHYSFVTPSAEVMKGVSIEDINYQHQWPRKRLKTKAGVHAKNAIGRSLVNPCPQCDMAADTGVGNYCGRCRSRPVTFPSLFDESYLGGATPQCRYASPRTNYVNSLRRQTCPRCEHTYRHNRCVADFIEDEGFVPNVLIYEGKSERDC